MTEGKLAVYPYEHFRVVVDGDRKTFSVHFELYVLDWQLMPANIAREIDAAITDWRKRGYRYI